MNMPARTIRTLIVDDEPLARERVRSMAVEEPDLDVIGEARDGLEAVDAILNQSPDLVFLDVQMPKLDGFGTITSVGAERMPPVVFVTAFDQHALRAFEVQALDYLLKPFDRTRFQGALSRVRQQIASQDNVALSRKLLALVRDVHTDNPTAPPQAAHVSRNVDRMVVKSGDRLFFLRTGDIDLIEAAGNYARLHVGAESYLLRETLNSIETRLPPDTFCRINRSHIVNIERIKELQPWFNGEYVVILRTGASLTLSRGYREKLQERFGRPL